MRGWVRIRRSDVGSLYTCLATSATPLLLGPPYRNSRTHWSGGRGQEQTSKCNYANLTRWGDTSSVEQLMRAGCSTRLM